MTTLLARRPVRLRQRYHWPQPVTACSVLDHRAAEMIALGRDLSTRALDDSGY